MTLYADSAHPVRADLEALHAEQISQLAEPGTWGTGAQRMAIVTEARKAGYEAGVMEKPEDPGFESDVVLPAVVRGVVRRLAVSPKDVDEEFYNQALKGGLTDAEYVEIVGIVARVTDFDVFARGIGVPLRPMPEPKEGEPTRERPPEAVQEAAWPPTIPNYPKGGEIAKELFGDHPKSYIIRGLSLVPNEVRAHYALETIQYLSLDNFAQWDFQQHEGLDRAQVEVVAGRVSAINECFF